MHRRFACVDDFLAHTNAPVTHSGDTPGGVTPGGERVMVATALADNAINVYSAKAAELLRQPLIYLLLGTEADGLPPRLLSLTQPVQIPSMSASINVGCAFAIVLTVMILAKTKRCSNNVLPGRE